MARWVLFAGALTITTVAGWLIFAMRMTSQAIKWSAWLDERLDAIEQAESA